MKRMFLFLALTLTLYAQKSITLTHLEHVQCRIMFNVDAGESEPRLFYPIAIFFYGMALDENRIVQINTENVLLMGQGRESPYTPKEIYLLLRSQNVALADQLKALYLETINQNITE